MVSNKVRLVTGYVPLDVKHMSREEYFRLGDEMMKAAVSAGAELSFYRQELRSCWAYELCIDKKPATETPSDRYDSPIAHVKSHIVQHNRTEWAMKAVDLCRETEVIIWLDLGILKQGKWNGNPVTADDVKWFVEAVQMYPFGDIPFPGITGRDPWLPHGNNWRFCGSTHVWPVKWLTEIDRSYKHHLRSFVRAYDCVPLDLAIWPLVEKNSGLPFRWYKAEYDASQLRNFPCAL